MRQRLKILLAVVLVVVAVAALTACGGGGGGGSSNNNAGTTYSLYGTAAAGSPIAGVVNVKGANGATASTTIGLDGSYGFTAAQLADLTKPYMLFAEGNVNGKSARLYSACVDDGRINVTPITDFIVRNALAMAAETAYASFSSVASSVTNSTLAAAENKVQTQLQPLLTAAGVTNPDLMSGQFSADHSGVDKVMDIVSISYNGAGTTATVTNTVTNSSFTDNVTNAADDSNALPPSDETATQSALTDEQSISNLIGSICSLYVTSRPTWTTLNNWALANVDANFLEGGENRDQMVSAWTVDNEGPGVGCTMTAAITGLVSGGTNTVYKVAITYRDPSFSGTFNFDSQMRHDGSKWLWYGDRKWLWVDIGAEMHRRIDNMGTTFMSGINMNLNDNYGHATAQGVQSAVVSATVGTTTGYVVLSSNFPNNWFSIHSGICSNGNYGSHCWLSDSIISQMVDYGSYTVKLCSETAAALASNPAACTALQTYTGAIGKKPLLNTQLTNAMFPSLTTPSTLSVSGLGWDDGFIQLNWINATAGLAIDWVDMGWPTATGYGWAGQDVTGTSVNLDTAGQTAIPTNAWLWLSGSDDINGQQYSSEWQFQ